MTPKPASGGAVVSKAELVYRQLKADIEAGVLAPGTPLAELALVERTGASRTPVREALRRLAAEGLADLVPRQGARVSRVSPRSVRDLFDFRTLLEPEAMRQVAASTTSDAELRRTLTSLRTEFARIQRRRPSAARSATFYQLADRFDWIVIGATRNEHLRRTIAELRPHTARLRNLSHADPSRIGVSVVEHLHMCDALLAGDSNEAGRACAHHLAQSLSTIFRTLRQGSTDTELDDLDLLA
jgi:DNA-binding GntR family transcriptional regulator